MKTRLKPREKHGSAVQTLSMSPNTTKYRRQTLQLFKGKESQLESSALQRGREVEPGRANKERRNAFPASTKSGRGFPFCLLPNIPQVQFPKSCSSDMGFQFWPMKDYQLQDLVPCSLKLKI